VAVAPTSTTSPAVGAGRCLQDADRICVGEGVFIRRMATRGIAGECRAPLASGIDPRAAGKDSVLIETVGSVRTKSISCGPPRVGGRTRSCTGDEVQAPRRGSWRSDIFVVNKADAKLPIPVGGAIRKQSVIAQLRAESGVADRETVATNRGRRRASRNTIVGFREHTEGGGVSRRRARGEFSSASWWRKGSCERLDPREILCRVSGTTMSDRIGRRELDPYRVPERLLERALTNVESGVYRRVRKLRGDPRPGYCRPGL